jgi:hypothetical protein
MMPFQRKGSRFGEAAALRGDSPRKVPTALSQSAVEVTNQKHHCEATTPSFLRL